MSELTRLSACAAVDLLRRGKVSPLEMIDAAIARIEATDGQVNALPTLCIERARAHAQRLMGAGAAAPTEVPLLAGLPIAVKDLKDVAGVRTTYGSPIFADHVPERSDIVVETLEDNGAIVLAKSNTPEFGHGANTFNEVFGKTRNPWNTAMTCGGSSGGAAVAVATGQVWLATGSDLGCSLRTPAAFCSVVGLRPAPGRVARGPLRAPYDNLWVEGPMARTVADAALMLDAQVGTHPADPISLAAPERPFMDAVESPEAPRRIAYSPDLGGIVPVANEVAEVCAAAAARFSELGADVEEACPDLSDARAIFHVLRAYQLVSDLAPLLDDHRDVMKPGSRLEHRTGPETDGGRPGPGGEGARRPVLPGGGVLRDLRPADFPATIVPPFDVDIRYVTEVEGHTLDTYFDWYAIAYAITITSCPAVSVPCGFTADGLPVGLQLVGAPREKPPCSARRRFSRRRWASPEGFPWTLARRSRWSAPGKRFDKETPSNLFCPPSGTGTDGTSRAEWNRRSASMSRPSCAATATEDEMTEPDWNHRYIDANGVRIHYVRHGAGMPLVLLHGWPEFWRTWRKNILPLAEHFDVVVPDLRGFGDTEKPDLPVAEGYGLEIMVEDLSALAEGLGLGRFGIVSHDVGSYITRAFAEKISRPGWPGCSFSTAPTPGIGKRRSDADHVNENWYRGFHQLPWAAELVGHSRETCRLYFAHFLSH